MLKKREILKNFKWGPWELKRVKYIIETKQKNDHCGPGKTLCFLPVEATAGQGRHSFLLLDKHSVDAAPGVVWWNSTAMFSPRWIQPHTLQALNRKKMACTGKDLTDFQCRCLILIRGGSEKETTMRGDSGEESQTWPCPYLSPSLPPFWALPRLTPKSVGIAVSSIQPRLNFLHKNNHVKPSHCVLLSSVVNEEIMWPANTCLL